MLLLQGWWQCGNYGDCCKRLEGEGLVKVYDPVFRMFSICLHQGSFMGRYMGRQNMR